MNENTSRGLLAAGLSANVLLLALALLDYSVWESEFMWPIFVAWAFLIILIVILAFVSAGIRVEVIQSRAAPMHFEHVAPAAPKVAATTSPPFKSPSALGPFQFNGYTLYSTKMALKGEDGKERTIYFFAKKSPKSGHPIPKPFGYHVGVNERTGLPFLKKGSGKDGEDLTPEIESAPRPQCSALTGDGKQCRNSSRGASKYCASHFGYQPPTAKGIAKRIEGESWNARDKKSDKASVLGADTKPASSRAADTKVSVRKKSSA